MPNPWEKFQNAPEQSPVATTSPQGADGPWAKFKSAQSQSDAKALGESQPGFIKGAISTLQGPAMGFMDELAGVGGAITGAVANLTPWGDGKSIAENYRDTRDAARAASDAHMRDNPIQGHVERIAASMPVVLASGAAQVAQGGKGILSAIPESMRQGAKFGAVSGLGESNADTVKGGLTDAAIAGGVSGVLGPLANAAVRGGAAIASNVGQQIASTQAGRNMQKVIADVGLGTHDGDPRRYAAEKIVEAMSRDKPNLSNPLSIISARNKTLGDEATLADAAGQNTKQILDTLATLPGATKNAAERLLHSRQAGRADRLIGAAEEGLSPNGARLSGTLEALDASRRQAAAPLYERVRDSSVPVDQALDDILQRATGAFGRAKELAGIMGEKFHLGDREPVVNALMLRGQRSAPLAQLDTLKRSLFDLEQSHINAETGRLSEVGNAYKNLRRDLVSTIDRLTTDPNTGTSFYKAARDAYAGPTELRAAANLGSQAMSKDAWKIAELTDGLSPSELEAFRIGAFESLRKKLGTESGQTQIMKSWKEPATSEKLKELFGNERSYREFAASVAKEARLKGLESVGRGSQTAARAAGLGDLDMSALTDAGHAARSAATGNIPGLLSSASSAWNRVKTPESVRNQIGEMLLSKGAKGAQNLNEIRNIMDRILEERAKRAAQAGTFAGLL